MSRTTLIANVSARIGLVSGMVPAPQSFSALNIPAHGLNGWFVLWPDAEATGAENGGVVLDRLAFRCEFLWRLNEVPAACIGAAMDKAKAIRSKLRDGTVTAVDNGAAPSIDVGTITYQRSPDGGAIVVSIPFVIDVFTSV